eukprot:UN28255
MESMDDLLHSTSKSQRKSLYSNFCSSVFLQAPLISKLLYYSICHIEKFYLNFLS